MIFYEMACAIEAEWTQSIEDRDGVGDGEA